MIRRTWSCSGCVLSRLIRDACGSLAAWVTGEDYAVMSLYAMGPRRDPRNGLMTLARRRRFVVVRLVGLGRGCVLAGQQGYGGLWSARRLAARTSTRWSSCRWSSCMTSPSGPRSRTRAPPRSPGRARWSSTSRSGPTASCGHLPAAAADRPAGLNPDAGGLPPARPALPREEHNPDDS